MHVSEGPQRFDVFTGGGRRRRFTTAEKAAIVEESYADGTSVCGVARRHGLTPQQLFGWRRLARLGPSRSAERPLFVPVIVASEPEAVPRDGASTGPKPRRRRRRSEGAGIELEIAGVVVRVGRDADAGAIAAVIGALKAGS
jgi:transposase